MRRAALALTTASCADSAAKKSRGRAERLAGERADVTGGHRGEARMGVHAGAHGGAAERQLVQRRERAADRGEGLIELGHPAADHLPERERRGVLQVRAADHDHAGELLGLAVQRVAQFGDSRDEHVLELLHGGDVHDGREGVVAGLPQVHVVVGMDGPAAAPPGAGQLVGAVGDHFVGVHVALRAGAGLEDDQGELGVEGAVDDLLSGARDELGLVLRQQAELRVGARRRQLEDAERADHRPPPAEPVGADGEVLHGALRLRAPVVPGRDAHLAHAVVLDAPLVAHAGNTTRFVTNVVQPVCRARARGAPTGDAAPRE